MINFALFVCLVCLNAADALLTKAGAANEANPLILYLMLAYPESWIAIKIWFTGTLGFILFIFKAQRLLALGVVVYSLLCVYHAILLESAMR